MKRLIASILASAALFCCAQPASRAANVSELPGYDARQTGEMMSA
jgi:hypothetical protein